MVAERKPTEESVDGLPFSCSTNLSNDVIEHIGMLGPGPLALRFLTRMHRKTFGDAGDHRKRNESFLTCTFDLAGWAAALGCNRSNLLKTRDHLEESHFFTFEPGAPGSGKGELTWNINFEEWTYYHRRVAKRQQAGLVPFRVVKTQLNPLDSAPHYSKTELSTVGKDGVTELSLPAVAICNRTKDGCFEAVAGQAPDSAKKGNYEKKDYEEESANADALALPDAAPLPVSSRISSSSKKTPRQETLFGGEPQKGTAATPAASPKKRAKKEPTPEEQERLARIEAEKVALEARKSAIAAVWLAHPRTVNLEQMSESERRNFYSGMTKLAKTTLTLEELPSLLDVQAGYFDGTYVPDPHKMENSLGTLRLKANRRSSANTAKGATHAGRNNHQASQRRDSESSDGEYIYSEDEYGVVTILSAASARARTNP